MQLKIAPQSRIPLKAAYLLNEEVVSFNPCSRNGEMG